MTVTEEQRHELHEWVKRVGGREVAATLMELLPPVGWADVATKRDLDAVEHRMGRLESELSGLRVEMHQGFTALQRDLRVQLYWILGFLLSTAAAILAAVRLG